MRDHQFDWKQVYSLLDHINDLTKSMNQMTGKPSKNSKSSRQQSHARKTASQLAANAVKSLQAMQNIDGQYKTATCNKIKHLNEYNQKVLGRNQDNAFQHRLVKGTQLQLRKLVAHAKLNDLANAQIKHVKGASLSKAQKTAAISEIESTLQFSANNLAECQSLAGVHNIIISSTNAMNGALVKYIVDSKIDDINRLNVMSRQIRKQIADNSKLGSTLKSIANQAIESIRTQAVVDLMTQSNDSFQKLSQIEQQSLTDLKHVVTSVNNLRALEDFIALAKKDIVVAVPLTVNAKLQLKQRIDQFKSVIINNFQGAYRYVTTDELNQEKSRLAIIVLKMVNTQYQDKITNQALDISPSQRAKLISDVKRTAHGLCQNFVRNKTRKPIHVNDLITSLNKLQSIMNERQSLAYDNQVHQLVKEAQLQINQFSDFSASDKHYLWILVANFGKSLQARKSHLSLAKVRTLLQKLFSGQVKYIENYSLKYQFEDLLRQIRISHLSKDHTENLSQQLTNIQKNDKLNYSNKLLFLKTIQNYGLVLDQNQNLQRLSTLSKKLSQKTDPKDVLVLRQHLEQNLFEFNQEIDQFHDILSLDHYEQARENVAYQIWFKIVMHGNSIKQQKLTDVTTMMKRAHRQVKLAVLEAWLNHVIVDQIDQVVNHSLLVIGQSYDMDKIKAEPAKLKHSINNQFKQALVRTKQIYSGEIDRTVRDVQNRLVAYPAFKSVVGKIGLIRSRAMTRIDNFADLIHVEHVKQENESNLYRIVSHIVDAGNTTKKLGHQRIQKMVESVNKELLAHKSDSADVNLAFVNRILLVQNHADACIDQDLNRQVEGEIKHGQKSLGMILRRHYLHRWSKIITHSTQAVNNLDSIAADVRQKALDSINAVKGDVATKLGRKPINTLYQTLRKNQLVINKIARHTIYLDPVKKHAFDHLSQLTGRTRQYITTHTKGMMKKTVLKNLTRMNRQVKAQISTCPDKKVKSVYKAGTKKITALHLNMVRGVKMRHFTVLTNSITREVRSLRMLAPSQKHHFNAQFNRTYHKSIYDIKHSPDIAYSAKNEKRGERQMNQIFAQVSQINERKQKLYQQVKDLIQSDRHLVQELRYINPDDKDNSDRLLLQAQAQTLKKIKKAAQSIQLKKISQANQSIAKQIVNEVSSANVLIAAIKSAENLVAHSKLDADQKKQTMHQIKTIFKDGINVQKSGNTGAVKRSVKAEHPKASKTKPKAKSQKNPASAKAKPTAKAQTKQKAPAKREQGKSVVSTEQYRRHGYAMPHPIRSLLKKLGKVF